jgi:hypothetical protein
MRIIFPDLAQKVNAAKLRRERHADQRDLWPQPYPFFKPFLAGGGFPDYIELFLFQGFADRCQRVRAAFADEHGRSCFFAE